ncbi:STAS domain-containing protein [Actinokineospora globicatena]|uniref:STAS domain-containing protein n=1 Tax=Actinokineospora globicatena TaxID=103729 RepID=UPI0020A2772F|nr:STAS domain-containing protein [Actinokineospora globicatena]MCP2304501.1 rsbT co-antagonist protein RsbR [Actinokineospora globicatena]GLW78131.1 polyvinylalcohol dehydrogenase [Actinokineospora globicatena]GLW85203.1 polyvinylalcohol dehydrogenase [Actinokineospora globicatena]
MTIETGRSDNLADLLRTGAAALTARWVELAAAPLRGRLSPAELERELSELYGALLSGVDSGARDVAAEPYAELRGQLADLSRRRARAGFTPSETAIAVFALKQALFEFVDRDDAQGGLREVVVFSQLLDALGLQTFETYAKAREEVIDEQAEQLLELTTPVVKLWDGVLAVPLVGTLDSARTQVVMEKLLEALVTTGAAHAIIDITGVLAVDTQVAQHLLKTVMAARLMGAECTISGIRPHIAQTIVALGIEFGDITTKSSLADALRHALRRSGVDVVTADRRG